MDMSYDEVRFMRLEQGAKDKFWKAEVNGSTLTITTGDSGTAGKSETKSFPTPGEASEALTDALLDKANRKYYEISAQEFAALLEPGDASRGAQSSQPADAAPAPPQKTVGGSSTSLISPVKKGPLPASTGAHGAPKREGPYAAAFTGPVVHQPKFNALAKAKKKAHDDDDPPRATSGGRPILAEGQPWPSCGYCGEQLGLFLQFDIEPRFELALPPGSHFVMFHCATCNAVPPNPPNLKLPQEWLDPGYQSSYRIILNRPDAREVAHQADPLIVEQRLTFSGSAERIAQGLDGPIGQRTLKIGGVPHWVQPPAYPECACGAPMGFVMQVPTRIAPGWTTTKGTPVPFAGGLDAFVFACTAESNPYATVMIVQR